MNKCLVLLLGCLSNYSVACGGISIKNETSHEISVGYDISRLRAVKSGDSLEFEKRHSHDIHIKNKQQNCRYRIDSNFVVKNLKSGQFVVLSSGEEIEPKECQ